MQIVLLIAFGFAFHNNAEEKNSGETACCRFS